MDSMKPTIRLHLWLENGQSVIFGYGRVMLLDKIEEHGSLRKAANALGMSYQAAWNKLRSTEKALGIKLVETPVRRCDGMCLTDYGRALRDSYRQWFEAVENCALLKAEHMFPWPVRSFDQPLPTFTPHL